MTALLLTVVMALAPGDATRLSPGPADTAAPTTTVPEAPAPEPIETPIVPIASIIAAGIALAGTLLGRKGKVAPGNGLGLSGDPLVVFVPGHGNAPEDFDGLIDLMDLEPEEYRVFDYRWGVPTTDPVHASQALGVGDTAAALNAYLAGVTDGDREVYLVGFSKGGAGIAEMVSRWDEGLPPPVPGVVGAALLDPPISGGFQGFVQSLGRYVGPIPDDGGYDPIECMFDGCVDHRDHLGEGAGIEVLVIRNPKAGITNFDDRPDGLRVYDVPDEGRGPLAAFFHNPFSYSARVAEAHEAVLHDRRVAECIRAELTELGSCDIESETTAYSGSGAWSLRGGMM
ncbi:MAG: alpha/beta hydrolase [Actinobacteria bacterium]|nr:alpha/beta hydrolase [Actinomycetota bacterium]